MVIVNESTIPSVVIEAGTPPVLPERPPFPRESLEPLFYGAIGTATIGNDTDIDIVARLKKREYVGQAWIKEYRAWQSSSGSVYGEDNSGYSTHRLPFVAYTTRSTQTALETLNPLRSGVYVPATHSLISTPYFSPEDRHNRNGLYQVSDSYGTIYRWEVETIPTVDALGNALPYGTESPSVSVRPDGKLVIVPQRREATLPYSLKLPVVANEQASLLLSPEADFGVGVASPPTIGISSAYDPPLYPAPLVELSNDQVNAFSLHLAIQPGCDDQQNTGREWSVEIRFGEVKLTIIEGKSEATIQFTGKEPKQIPIFPTFAQSTTHHSGERPLDICFVPVWNGLLIGYGPIQESTWPEKMVYVQKTPGRTILSEIATVLDFDNNDPTVKKTIPRTLPKLSPDVNSEDSTEPNPLPPGGVNANPVEITDTDDAEQVFEDLPQTPYETTLAKMGRGKGIFGNHGVKIPSEQDVSVDMGRILRVNYLRCGGVLQFRPLFFPAKTRTHIAVRGTAVESKKEKKPDELADIQNRQVGQEIFALQQADHFKILPVVYYPRSFEYFCSMKVLPGSEDSPIWDIYQEFVRTKRETFSDVAVDSWGYRRPLETWGCYVYSREYPDEDTTVIKFRNQDGFLTVNDVPVERIQRVDVSRSLDGSSGTLIWDRYGPEGLVDRPRQNAGAITIAVNGGVNTVSGTIFTGLAVGNAEQDTTSDNTIQISLFGREHKLQDQGGLKLLNVPYFDGFDHRQVIQYLADYGGVPFLNLSQPYKLPSGLSTVQAPIIDFKSGTPVWDAISEVCKHASCLAYFDRLGYLRYIETARSTNINWEYPSARVLSYNDNPDFSSVRNAVVVSALVMEGPIPIEFDFFNTQGVADQLTKFAKPVLSLIRVSTTPVFSWDKMMFFPIPGVFRSMGEFNKSVLQIIKGVARPRSAGQVSIPGNAQIELLDRFNSNWIVTSVAHTADTQSKNFLTNLGLELFVEPNLSDVEIVNLPVQGLL